MKLLDFLAFVLCIKCIYGYVKNIKNEECSNSKEYGKDLPCIKEGNKYTIELNKKNSVSAASLKENNLLFQQQIVPIPNEYIKAFKVKREEHINKKEEQINKNEKQINKHENDSIPLDEVTSYIRLPIIEGVKVGHEQILELFSGEKRKMKTLSLHPPIFEIEEFFDEDECDLLIEYAKKKKMKKKVKNTNGMLIHGSPQKTFKIWDLNGDGYVDAEELMLIPGKTDVEFTLEDADDMIFMLKMDKDEDRKIDLTELENTDLSQIKLYVDKLRQNPLKRRNITTESSWVWHDADELLRFQDEYFDAFHDRFASATGLPKEIIEESEPLKVEKFSAGEFQTCAHDSEPTSDNIPCCLYGESINCRLCRYASISIFLNDVEKGGELVFPLADNKYNRNFNNSGNWRGYYKYAKTSGSINHFEIDLIFKKNGSNQIVEGLGVDDSGQFEITNSIIIGETITFEKYYINKRNNNMEIKYAGKMLSGSMVVGNWWIPEKKRFYGTFFMWLKEYEIFMKKSLSKCNHESLCGSTGLSIKPKKGSAILWYNHRLSTKTGMIGDLEQETKYGHCATKADEAWIAKVWINVIGDGKEELRAWRRGKNWLSSKTKNVNIFNIIGTSKAPLPLEYYEEEFEKSTKETTKRDTVQEREGVVPNRRAKHIMSAINSILDILGKDEWKAISRIVNKKLSLTCIY